MTTTTVSRRGFLKQTMGWGAVLAFGETAFANNPPVDTSTDRSSAGASLFVLDMTPADAQLTVFATGAATLYMGLLPPDNKEGWAST